MKNNDIHKAMHKAEEAFVTISLTQTLYRKNLRCLIVIAECEKKLNNLDRIGKRV